VVALLVVALVGYFELNRGPAGKGVASTSSTSSSTSVIVKVFHGNSTSTYTVPPLPTSVETTSDVFLTDCSVTGIGGFELRVVSDSTGGPVAGANVTAVDELGCDIVGQPAQVQVVQVTSFSVGEGGWLTPVFPLQAEPGGNLNFTVAYQGRTFHFVASVPPIGTNCVTLHVPSGNVTSATVMNGNGSYCS
jgi:hypothetical protein